MTFPLLSTNTNRNIVNILNDHQKYSDCVKKRYKPFYHTMERNICFYVRDDCYEVLQVYWNRGGGQDEYRFRVRINGLTQHNPKAALESLIIPEDLKCPK